MWNVCTTLSRKNSIFLDLVFRLQVTPPAPLTAATRIGFMQSTCLSGKDLVCQAKTLYIKQVYSPPSDVSTPFLLQKKLQLLCSIKLAVQQKRLPEGLDEQMSGCFCSQPYDRYHAKTLHQKQMYLPCQMCLLFPAAAGAAAAVQHHACSATETLAYGP